MKVKYIPIRVHSSYSLLRSTIKIDNLISKCKEYKIPAIAINDSQNMFGICEFTNTALKAGVQPIISSELILNDDTVIVLIAKSEIGYKNLIKLSTLSYYQNKKININDLIKYNKDLIILFSYRNFIINIKQGVTIKELNKIFHNDLYLEISRCNGKNVEKNILQAAQDYGVNIVAVNESFFFNKQDYIAYKALRCIDEGNYINNYNDAFITDENYFKTPDEMSNLFSDLPTALENTVIIAKKACFILEKKPVEFPQIKCNYFPGDEKKEIMFLSLLGLFYRLLNKYDLNCKEKIYDKFFHDIAANNFHFYNKTDDTINYEDQILHNILKIIFLSATDIINTESDVSKISNIDSNSDNNLSEYINKLPNLETKSALIDNDHSYEEIHHDDNDHTQIKSANYMIKTMGLKVYLHFINDVIKYFKQSFYELKVIIKMGFSGYFLIVSDFIKWAKANNILVGPGRGSGAGSIIAWSLQITAIDPIKYSLVFERFLNPDRVSMPDFDIDFCQERRNEVISYIKAKYGEDKVAHIITFGKLQAKAAIRDVGRVLQMPYKKVDSISTMMPHSGVFAVSLKESIDNNMQKIIDNDYEIEKLFNIAFKVEGAHRNISIHAAGIIISAQKLDTVIPLLKEENSGEIITQLSMHHMEDSGLVKFDLLGLKTLTIIQKTMNLLKDKFDINKIPLNDKKTYEFLKQKINIGVFQLEGSGMSQVLKKLEPNSIEDISVLISLYRPGPMEKIPEYIDLKHNIKKPNYQYNCLKDVLMETYGIPVYQEQVIKIAQVLAGYTLSEADLLRRAMGKKDLQEMQSHEEKFIKNADKLHGGGEKKAKKLFDQIAAFAGYAFNKAHAAAYAMIAYQTGYLKTNYTIEFYVAMMNLDKDNTDKMSFIYQECKKLNIKILPPDINKSDVGFTIEDITIENTEDKTITTHIRAIRYGLSAIKGLGEKHTQELVENRKKQGNFNNIYDILERIQQGSLNKRKLEHLISSGSLDNIHTNRRQVFESVTNLIASKNIVNKTNNLFEMSTLRNPLNKVDDWSKNEKLKREFEVFGFYLNDHPIESYKKHVEYSKFSTSKSVKNKIFATLEVISKRVVNKSREKYAFMKVSDQYGSCELTIFPKKLAEYENILEEGENYIFYVQEKSNRLICNGIVKLNEMKKLLKTLTIDFNQKTETISEYVGIKEVIFNITNNDDLNKTKKILAGIYSTGDITVILDIKDKKKIQISKKINFNELVNELRIAKILKGV